MIFSQRDVDALRLLCWCQFIKPKDLSGVVTNAEQKNLISLGLVRIHEKSGAMLLTSKGSLLLERLLDGAVPQMSRAYHAPLIERRVRVSRLAVTAYAEILPGGGLHTGVALQGGAGTVGKGNAAAEAEDRD